MRRPGLGSRLLALGILAALLVAGIGGWLLRENLHAVLLRGFEQRLSEHADRIAARLHGGGGRRIAHDEPRAADEFSRIFSGWYWQLAQGSEGLHSRSLWDAELAVPAAAPGALLRVTGPRGEPLLGIGRAIEVETTAAVLWVFGPAEEVDRERRGFDQLLASTLAGLVLALAAATWMQVRIGLHPLTRLRGAVAAVQSGRADRVGAGFGPDLDPLAAELDAVLERNARVTARARSHAADLAHALKKPLALIATDAAAGDEPIAAQVRSMSRLIDRHLARAGSGAGERRRLPVAARIEALIELMRRLHEARALQWRLEADAAAHWRGEPTDLDEMLGNLLDNAGKWARSRVEVTAAREGAALCVTIDDDGPGLTPEQIAQASRRGRRFDESVEGSGLGLAIAADIAETYGGRLELRAGPLGGLRVRLQLPD